MPASMNSAQLDVQFGNWDAVPAASVEPGSAISFTADVASQQPHYGASTHRYCTQHVVNNVLQKCSSVHFYSLLIDASS